MKYRHYGFTVASLLAGFCLAPSVALADGRVVDKVYHPYVQPLEREIEYRYVYQRQPHHPDNNDMAQQVGYGFSLTERTALALYVLSDRKDGDPYKVSAYEAELRWMLTEQGQYSWDWGMLFEFEKEQHVDNYEFTTGLLLEKEFRRTSVAINALAVHEWGQTVAAEWEAEFRLQYRYRYLSWLQPSLEIYSGENYHGAGPGIIGVHKFTPTKQLRWEVTAIFPLDHDTIDNTARFALRYEF